MACRRYMLTFEMSVPCVVGFCRKVLSSECLYISVCLSVCLSAGLSQKPRFHTSPDCLCPLMLTCLWPPVTPVLGLHYDCTSEARFAKYLTIYRKFIVRSPETHWHAEYSAVLATLWGKIIIQSYIMVVGGPFNLICCSLFMILVNIYATMPD